MNKKNNFLRPEVRARIRQVVRDLGTPVGQPSDRTLLNRFYQVKEHLKKEHGKLLVDAAQLGYAGTGFKEQYKRDMKIVEDIEHDLFEEEFLVSKDE